MSEAFTEIPEIIDALAFLGKGRRPVTPELYGHDPETLLEEMDQKGISGAVVHHNLSWLSHPLDGNAEAMRLIEGRPRLRACWALLSKASREYGSFDAYVEGAVAAGARCFSVFPRLGALPLGNDTSIREFVRAGTFAAVEERGLPLFLDFNADPAGAGDTTDWEALRALLAAHPGLPVILCEFRLRGGNRVFPGVMDDHPNLHLETSGMWNYLSLEFVARHWGAERLIFGTRTPWRGTGLALGMVTMADLTARERAMVLGGNIRRLMEGAGEGSGFGVQGSGAGHGAVGRPAPNTPLVVAGLLTEPPAGAAGRPAPNTPLVVAGLLTEPPAGAAGRPAPNEPGQSAIHNLQSAIHTECLLGERLSGEVLLDCHAHIGRHADYVIPDGEPEELAAEMRRLNIRGAFAFQFTGVQTGEVSYGNDVVADACRRVPGRFLGMTMVNPVFERDVLPELERCRALGFVGIKLINSYQGYPDDGPLLDAVCAFAHEHRMPILNHSWGPKLEERLRSYSGAQFITGHWDPGRAGLARQYDNLWICTCLPIPHESFERGMRDLRPDRVMWGSDMSDLQFGCGLGPILLARVSDDVKRRVIGLNMRDLLQTCRIPEPPAWPD